MSMTFAPQLSPQHQPMLGAGTTGGGYQLSPGGMANMQDWLKAWKAWANTRKRGKMAQFIVQKLEDSVSCCGSSMERGRERESMFLPVYPLDFVSTPPGFLSVIPPGFLSVNLQDSGPYTCQYVLDSYSRCSACALLGFCDSIIYLSTCVLNRAPSTDTDSKSVIYVSPFHAALLSVVPINTIFFILTALLYTPGP